MVDFCGIFFAFKLLEYKKAQKHKKTTPNASSKSNKNPTMELP
jgi:hypothetical protein